MLPCAVFVPRLLFLADRPRVRRAVALHPLPNCRLFLLDLILTPAAHDDTRVNRRTPPSRLRLSSAKREASASCVDPQTRNKNIQWARSTTEEAHFPLKTFLNDGAS